MASVTAGALLDMSYPRGALGQMLGRPLQGVVIAAITGAVLLALPHKTRDTP